MPRTPTARPPQQHLATCTRMLGQVDKDEQYSGERRAKLKKALGVLIAELNAEIAER